MKKKTILVAPLYWGLGHATRCIPIIKNLLDCNYNVIVASDGGALLLLQKEFPLLKSITLPSYNISYPKNGNLFKWKLLLKIASLKEIIASEKKIIETFVSENNIDGIISDNRFGVRSNKVPSVYLTHQLNVFSGNTTFFSSLMHRKIIKKFDECWVPDVEGNINLSGDLGHLKKTNLPIKYLGVLSRMKKNVLPIKYDILLLLSGPEPQRTLLEELLIKEFKNKNTSVLMVQGRVEDKQKTTVLGNITCYNFMQTIELEKAINESKIVISRSGYTSVMDFTVLNKNVFFIPTPGQYEQEYLAKQMCDLKMAPYCTQKDFTAEKLNEISNFNGMKLKTPSLNFKSLFSLFEGK